MPSPLRIPWIHRGWTPAIIGPKMPQIKELYKTMLKYLSTESLKNFISNVGWLSPLDDCFSIAFTIQLDVTYYS